MATTPTTGMWAAFDCALKEWRVYRADADGEAHANLPVTSNGTKRRPNESVAEAPDSKRANGAVPQPIGAASSGHPSVEFLPAPRGTIVLGPFTVRALGMGTLPLGVTYSGGGRPDRTAAVALIHGALDSGVNFFDTADVSSCLHGLSAGKASDMASNNKRP